MNTDNCLCKSINRRTMESVVKSIPGQFQMERLCEIFKMMGEPSRLRIIHLLTKLELCVADIAILLKMHQPAVSQQLKLLRLAHLVKFRKEGKTVYYSLDDEHVRKMYTIGLKHLLEQKRD